MSKAVKWTLKNPAKALKSSGFPLTRVTLFFLWTLVFFRSRSIHCLSIFSFTYEVRLQTKECLKSSADPQTPYCFGWGILMETRYLFLSLNNRNERVVFVVCWPSIGWNIFCLFFSVFPGCILFTLNHSCIYSTSLLKLYTDRVIYECWCKINIIKSLLVMLSLMYENDALIYIKYKNKKSPDF